LSEASSPLWGKIHQILPGQIGGLLIPYDSSGIDAKAAKQLNLTIASQLLLVANDVIE
jgi:hypothetical protein